MSPPSSETWLEAGFWRTATCNPPGDDPFEDVDVAAAAAADGLLRLTTVTTSS